MKFKLLILIFLPFCLSAQYRSYQVGVKAGANYSDINANELDEPFLGAHLGGFVTGTINDHFQVSSEIFYSLQGASFSYPADHQLKSNLLNFNTSLRFFPVKRIHIHTGIQLGFMLKQKLGKYEFTAPEREEDISLLIGTGYSITDRIEVLVRYSHGIAAVENRVVLLSVGYSIFNVN